MRLSGIVYVWIGSKSDPEDVKVAEEIVQQGILYDKERFSMQVRCLDICESFETSHSEAHTHALALWAEQLVRVGVGVLMSLLYHILRL